MQYCMQQSVNKLDNVDKIDMFQILNKQNYKSDFRDIKERVKINNLGTSHKENLGPG